MRRSRGLVGWGVDDSRIGTVVTKSDAAMPFQAKKRRSKKRFAKTKKR